MGKTRSDLERKTEGIEGNGSAAAGSAGTGTAGTGGEGAEGEERPRVSRLDLVNQSEPRAKEVEIPEKDVKVIVKKKKMVKKTKGKAGSPDELKPLVAALLAGIFGVLEQRDVNWKVPEAELELIADPGSRILARWELLSGSSENMDYVLLAFGLVMVCGPRIVKTITKKREEAGPDADSRNTQNAGGRTATENPSGSADSDLHRGSAKAILPGIQ